MSGDPLFPILFGYRVADEITAIRREGVASLVIAIPWAMIEPHEAQAQRNHSQSLRRLAERGGLGACEAVAVLEGRRYRSMPPADAQRRLADLVAAYRAALETRETGGQDAASP